MMFSSLSFEEKYDYEFISNLCQEVAIRKLNIEYQKWECEQHIHFLHVQKICCTYNNGLAMWTLYAIINILPFINLVCLY